MNQDKQRPDLWRPAAYRIEVGGHLNIHKATWFADLTMTNDYDRDGTPITIISGEVADQAMLHGLLTRIRDLGLPLLAVTRLESLESGTGRPSPHGSE